jgi:glutamate racemase
LVKIGIFDSGYGGLTIFRNIEGLLPSHDYIYLGDNARTPYGNRSFDTIYRFTVEGVRYLFGQDCRLIIIACNTASAKALRNVQQRILPTDYPDRRVLGVIRPSAEELSRFTKTRAVALWGTEGTVNSLSFVLELQKLAPEIDLYQQACPMLVPLVEAGELQGSGVEYYVREYWRRTILHSGKVDVLLLACTHYPLILPVIRKIVPPEVRILVQGEIVAPSLADYLRRHPEIETAMSREGTRRFLTTDQSELFDRLAEAFLGYAVCSEKVEISGCV